MRADELAVVLKISGGKDEEVHCRLSRPTPNTQEYLSAHQAGPHPPLVSCIMVTRGVVPILRHSVECFCHQTYPNRELVVVYDGEQEGIEAFFRSVQLPRVILVSVPSVFSLGELRNIGIARASGQIIAQWDDDDLFDPSRLSMCVRTLVESGTAAVFLGSWLLWWPARAMIGVGGERIWEGSIVAWRGAMPVYPAMRRGEDTLAVDWLIRCHPITMILGNPALYLYTATGKNTWGGEHFEKAFQHATAVYRGEDYTQLVDALQARVPILQYRDEIARLP